MAEYIDREELLERLKDWHDSIMKDPEVEKLTKWREAVVYSNTVKIINKIPADDVTPVRHGRWLTWEEQFPGQSPKKKSGLGVFCDQCHKHADNRTDFCPNCGAYNGGADNAVD